MLYVYPGETVDQLAGITAFEIGHEVDAAAVEPQGGETQIENILGIHPASWAPELRLRRTGVPLRLVRSRLLQLLVAGRGRLEPDRPGADRRGRWPPSSPG